jgi:hypothetical protein
MADPLTWMAIASAVSAAGAYSAGRTQEKVAGAQAKSMENAAIVERQNAETARQMGDRENEALGRQQRQVAGAQRAAAAQSGAGLGGSVGDVLDQESVKMQLDRLNLSYKTDLESRAFEQKASDLDTQAKYTRYQGRAARRAGNLSAGVSLLMAGAYGYGAMGGGAASQSGAYIGGSGPATFSPSQGFSYPMGRP